MDNSSWHAALAVFGDHSKYPYIPRALVENVRLAFVRGHNNRLTEQLPTNPVDITETINQMFEMAVQATELSADDLLQRTDFNVQDTGKYRVDAAFAEIRIINFLQKQGFNNIQPLSAGNRQGADIVAERNGERYAVEVTHSIYDANHRFTPEDLQRWLLGKVRDDGKLKQLEKTVIEFRCQRRVLVAIVNTLVTVGLQTYQQFMDTSQLVWDSLGQDPDLHIAFVTGRGTNEYGFDDAIVPSWP